MFLAVDSEEIPVEICSFSIRFGSRCSSLTARCVLVLTFCGKPMWMDQVRGELVLESLVY